MRIGCVKYLNARPLVHSWAEPVEFDHPAALCKKLARGDLDVALVSSIEYLRRPNYYVVDDVSISADGPVYSVIVAHTEDLACVREIAVDPASESSVALLRCLLSARGLTPHLVVSNTSSQLRQGSKDCRPVLLIGDQAMQLRRSHPEYRFWDLAEEWKNITALPFVFALWLIRRDVPKVTELADRLRTLRDENLRCMEEIIAQELHYNAEFCRRYFRENVRFNFAAREKAGLREFHRRCLTCGIDVVRTAELNLV